MTEETKTTGRVKLEVYRYNTFLKRYVSRILGIFSENIRAKFRNKYGFLIQSVEVNNGITNTGFAAEAGLVGNTGSVSPFTYLAVGTSSTAFSASQTALLGEISTSGLARASATVSRVTTTQTNDTLQLTKTFVLSGSATVEEVGAFNASSSGVMLGRALTGTVTLVSGDEFIATYKFKFA
jgi:hypothetical protein